MWNNNGKQCKKCSPRKLLSFQKPLEQRISGILVQFIILKWIKSKTLQISADNNWIWWIFNSTIENVIPTISGGVSDSMQIFAILMSLFRENIQCMKSIRRNGHNFVSWDRKHNFYITNRNNVSVLIFRALFLLVRLFCWSG